MLEVYSSESLKKKWTHFLINRLKQRPYCEQQLHLTDWKVLFVSFLDSGYL